MKKIITLFLIVIALTAFGKDRLQTITEVFPSSSNADTLFFEDFSGDPQYTIYNLNNSAIQWDYIDDKAAIAVPADYQSNHPVWSVLIIPVNVLGYENPIFFLNHSISHAQEYDSYFARIEVRTHFGEWETLTNYEGNQSERSDMPYYEFDLSQYVIDASEISVRFQFFGGEDKDVKWEIDQAGIIASRIPGVPNPAHSPEPGNGSVFPYNAYLGWRKSTGPMAEGFRVYLDETYPPTTLVYEGQETSYYQTFEDNQNYYWKVVPFNDFGDAEGVEIWHFSTYLLDNFNLPLISDWVVENLSDSEYQWTTGHWDQMEISIPSDYTGSPVWSTLTSPAINLTGLKNIHIRFSGTIKHLTSFDNYYLKYLVSTDESNWETLYTVEGNIGQIDENAWFDSDQVNISHIADNQPQIFIRVEFNSNGDTGFHCQVYDVEMAAMHMLPENAILISPQNEATDVSTAIQLEWQMGEGGITDGYRLYLDENNPPETLLLESDTNSFYPEELQYNTQYFWKVVPFNSAGDAQDVQIWSFTTQDESTGIKLPSAGELSIFPNPSRGTVNITSQHQIIEIQIFDVIGNPVYVSKPAKKDTQINVHAFCKGIYILQIETTQGVSTQKIQVIK